MIHITTYSMRQHLELTLSQVQSYKANKTNTVMANKTVYPYGTGGSLPSSVGIINDLTTGGADKALSAEQGKELATVIGDSFFSELNVIDLGSYTVQLCTLGGAPTYLGKWYYNQSSDIGRHIAVPITQGSKYRLTLLPSAPAGSFYAFVTSAYNPPYGNGDSIPFISNETDRYTLVANEKSIFTAPNDAAFLILVYQDGGGNALFPFWRLEEFESGVIPETVEDRIVNLEESNFKKIRVLHWNLGHFALGASYDTTITQEQLDTMRSKWRNKINPIGADVVMTCEYNTNFVNASGGLPAVTARDAVFSNSIWEYAAIGSKPSATSYMQTATFSNIKLSGTKEVVYPQTVQAGRYYQESTILLGGKTVKIVATHLDYNQGSNGAAYRALQIQKLINDFSNDDYVIICADFNVAETTEFDAFSNAGYKMLNHVYLGDLQTYPSDSPAFAFDNIVCKGFTISNISIVEDSNKEFSDHLGIYADFTLIL